MINAFAGDFGYVEFIRTLGKLSGRWLKHGGFPLRRTILRAADFET